MLQRTQRSQGSGEGNEYLHFAVLVSCWLRLSCETNIHTRAVFLGDRLFALARRLHLIDLRTSRTEGTHPHSEHNHTTEEDSTRSFGAAWGWFVTRDSCIFARCWCGPRRRQCKQKRASGKLFPGLFRAGCSSPSFFIINPNSQLLGSTETI